ncbi:MAG: hypothetical protein C4323_21075 [Mastigocladus sp. ERB_26_2]
MVCIVVLDHISFDWLRGVIPFHHKSDTFGDKPDKGDKGDKEEDLYQEFCEMVLYPRLFKKVGDLANLSKSMW